jgi:hypothetical protein
LFLEARPNVPAYLAQLGKNLISKFISPRAGLDSVAASQKVLHLDMRDIDGRTEFPVDENSCRSVTLRDSISAPVSDTAVLARATRQWDPWVVDGFRRRASFT